MSASLGDRSVFAGTDGPDEEVVVAAPQISGTALRGVLREFIVEIEVGSTILAGPLDLEGAELAAWVTAPSAGRRTIEMRAVRVPVQPRTEGRKEPGDTVERIRVLFEANDVEGARRLVREATPTERADPEFQSWERVLAPPRAWAVPREGPRRDSDAERAWLREHATEYPGEWLALLGPELLAHGPDLGAVRAEARRRVDDPGVLLHFQPVPGWWTLLRS